ncbi:MAG: alanine dehydrogenase [Cyclobacteriaceae bacterium]
MRVAVPREIKNNENRVALTPAGVKEFVKKGHQVFIQKSAGEGSGFSDELYQKAGATLTADIEETYHSGEMIIKVKEPIASEYPLVQENQLLFTYFHFASNEPLTRAMIKSKAICLAYETVEKPDKSLPLLIPMSEVAGRMAVQKGANYLEKPLGGRGILLGGVPGTLPAKVLILGGGIVGTQAAWMASGLGADVVILDVSLSRMRYLSDVMPPNVKTMMSNEFNIRQLIPTADLIIGAVLIPGAKTPHLITKDMLAEMVPGTVLVDVAVDQGGCIETCKPTTHEAPTYNIDGVLHYCVANMPGAVPYTSTLALTNATLPYALELAENGWIKACQMYPELKPGLNIIQGDVVFEAVAETFDLPYTPVLKYLGI